MINGKYAFVAAVLAEVVLGAVPYRVSGGTGADPSCIH